MMMMLPVRGEKLCKKKKKRKKKKNNTAAAAATTAHVNKIKESMAGCSRCQSLRLPLRDDWR